MNLSKQLEKNDKKLTSYNWKQKVKITVGTLEDNVPLEKVLSIKLNNDEKFLLYYNSHLTTESIWKVLKGELTIKIPPFCFETTKKRMVNIIKKNIKNIVSDDNMEYYIKSVEVTHDMIKKGSNKIAIQFKFTFSQKAQKILDNKLKLIAFTLNNKVRKYAKTCISHLIAEDINYIKEINKITEKLSSNKDFNKLLYTLRNNSSKTFPYGFNFGIFNKAKTEFLNIDLYLRLDDVSFNIIVAENPIKIRMEEKYVIQVNLTNINSIDFRYSRNGSDKFLSHNFVKIGQCKGYRCENFQFMSFDSIISNTATEISDITMSYIKNLYTMRTGRILSRESYDLEKMQNEIYKKIYKILSNTGTNKTQNKIGMYINR